MAVFFHETSVFPAAATLGKTGAGSSGGSIALTAGNSTSGFGSIGETISGAAKAGASITGTTRSEFFTVIAGLTSLTTGVKNKSVKFCGFAAAGRLGFVCSKILNVLSGILTFTFTGNMGRCCSAIANESTGAAALEIIGRTGLSRSTFFICPIGTLLIFACSGTRAITGSSKRNSAILDFSFITGANFTNSYSGLSNSPSGTSQTDGIASNFGSYGLITAFSNFSICSTNFTRSL